MKWMHTPLVLLGMFGLAMAAAGRRSAAMPERATKAPIRMNIGTTYSS